MLSQVYRPCETFLALLAVSLVKRKSKFRMLEPDMTSNMVRSLARLRALWTLVGPLSDLSSESLNDGFLQDDHLLVMLFCVMLISFSLLHVDSGRIGMSASLDRFG